MMKKEIINSNLELESVLYFSSALSNNFFKKTDSENVSTQIHDFERRLCAQTQLLYIVETFHLSQMNPKEFVHNTPYSV